MRTNLRTSVPAFLAVLRCGVIAVAPLAPLAAQPATAEQAGFLGLVLTPVGALPSLVQGPASQRLARAALHARYGTYRFQGSATRFANVGIGGRLRVAERLDIGATVGSRSCADCEGLRMAGVEAEFHAWEKRGEGEGGDATLDVQLSGGIGKPNDARFTAMSVAAALPMAVTLRQSWEGAVTLFFAPTVGYGRIKDEDGVVLGSAGTGGAARMLLSAGGNVVFDRGLGLHAAVHRIAIDDSPTQIGFGLSYAFGGGPRDNR